MAGIVGNGSFSRYDGHRLSLPESPGYINYQFTRLILRSAIRRIAAGILTNSRRLEHIGLWNLTRVLPITECHDEFCLASPEIQFPTGD